jgi:thiosulfate dehydrogenase
MVVLLGLIACRAEPKVRAGSSGVPGAGVVDGRTETAVAVAHSAGGVVGFDAATWQPPADSEIPKDSLGASIRRGLALIVHTHDSLPAYAPGNINCTNCHLQEGREVDAIPLAGTRARFPKYMDRAGAVVDLTDRVNYCFTRSLAGVKLPSDSREMEDILAYLTFLSRGVPVGARTRGAEGLAKMPALVSDTGRGAQVYRTICVACHGPDGGGLPGFPALWGPRSYSVGASMARTERAASFIWHNMPYGRPKSLTPQQASDVAAYIDSKPRPDSPGKEDDWPAGGAPRDVPYDLRSGHRAHLPPPLIDRANVEGAVVPRPRSVMGTARGGTRG